MKEEPSQWRDEDDASHFQLAKKNVPNWDAVQVGCPYGAHGMKVAIVIQVVWLSEDKIAGYEWGNSVNVEYDQELNKSTLQPKFSASPTYLVHGM